MDKDLICDFQNLYKAYRKTKSGKKFNGSCARFQTMSLEGLHILKEQLENQTYSMNQYNKFKIYEPKERIIMASEYKDRVVHQWYVENFIKPYFVPQFINTSYA